ncbi:MAG: leucine-rich repeat domain-containing protein [Prevotella sp.]|nr:leucine-rich repeat domain-containing protein [Prevotella sp.]
MKKNLLKLLLATVCLLGSTNVSAYDFEVDGIYYDVISFSDLTCTVSNNGVNWPAGPYEGDIEIPATVSYNNRTLTVVEIASYAFLDCLELTGITIPNTISSIKDYAFRNCPKLERIKIEDGETVLNIGMNSGNVGNNGMFTGCPVVSLYLGRNLSYTAERFNGYSPFAHIKTLKELTISNYVTKINANAFMYCEDLTSVTIPNSVTDVEKSAFVGTGLINLTIPNSVITIGDNAFGGCPELNNLTISNSATKIGNGAFGYNPKLTNVIIPSSVTSIGDEAFEGCTGLTSVVIPNDVTFLGRRAFMGCTELTTVIVGNSVPDIMENTFRNCSNLTSVTIGSSVGMIGADVFNGCNKLAELYSLNPTPPNVYYTSFSSNFTNEQYMNLNVYVPQEALSAYQDANIWKNFWNLQGFDPTAIKGAKAENGYGVYYDLRGGRLSAPKRGLNIIKGKKVMMK